jgi:D-aminopeptidase
LTGWGRRHGIGTASRKAGSYIVEMLAQTNFGGSLRMNGAPVGQELRQSGPNTAAGSCVMVVATDAPVDARNLRRMAARTMFGLARTGSSGANGSGDYGASLFRRRGILRSCSQMTRCHLCSWR